MKPETANPKKTTLADLFYDNLDRYLKESYKFETSIEGIEFYKLKQ